MEIDLFNLYLILIENPKTSNVTVYWELTNNFEKDWKLICELNSGLEVIKPGNDPNGELLSFENNQLNNKFDNLQSLIKNLDQWFFYSYFDTF